MTNKTNTVKKSIIAIASLMIFATGCTTMNPNNQVRQQNVQDNNRGPQMLRNQNNNDFFGRPQAQRNQNNQNNVDNRIAVADKAAEKITKVKGVRQANVLVTRRNAYVAAALDSGQMTQQIEDQIARQVRAVDPNIQNVFVSTNPEFTDRVNGYVTDVQQGRPVAGFVEQFNEMVERIFPNAR